MYNFPKGSLSARSFMQVDGIVGDASDGRKQGWLPAGNVLVQCFAAGCPSGTDREIIVSRHIDAFSPELGKACHLHTRFAKIVVETFVESGGGWNRFYDTLNDAWIEKCSINWPGLSEEIIILKATSYGGSIEYDEGDALNIGPAQRH